MIVSHKHRFIFIKTEKTAGTSLEIALSKFCGNDDIITPISSKDERIRKELGFRGPQNYLVPFKFYSKIDWLYLFLKGRRKKLYNHIAAKELRKFINKEHWDAYFKFTFERNPFDKTISWYYFIGDTSKPIMDFIQSGKAGEIKGFELYTQGGIQMVDKVYKYEELNEALIDLQKRLQLTEKLEMPQKKAKGDVRKDKRKYSEVLSKEEKDLLSKIFAREILIHGYKFEE